jgi:hypothetical protein
MDVLDKMPRHLLKKEACLWHYDKRGGYEVLPVQNVVSPLNDGESKEWEPGGEFGLSLQSFDEEPEPKQTFIVDISTLLPQSFSLEADSMEEARDKANELLNNNEFFDRYLSGKWMMDVEWDATEIIQIVDGYDTHGDERFIAPEIVDKYTSGKEE